MTKTRAPCLAVLSVIAGVLVLAALVFPGGFAFGRSQQYQASRVQLIAAKTGAANRGNQEDAWRAFFADAAHRETRTLVESLEGESGIEVAFVASAEPSSAMFASPTAGDVAVRFSDRGFPSYAASTITKYFRLGRPAPRAVDPGEAFAIALDDWLLRHETGWKVAFPGAAGDLADAKAERDELDRRTLGLRKK